MQNLEEKNKILFKKLANKYDKGLFRKIMLKKIKKVIKNAEIKNNSYILDIGCGTGNLLGMLSKNKKLNLYGIDLSEDMLKIARIKLDGKAELKLGSVINLEKEYKIEFFDYVFISDAFHHFPEQEKVIDKIKIILKENGKLIIDDLSFGSFGNFIFNKLEPGNSGMHTLNGYKKLFRDKNFNEIKARKIGLASVYIEGKNNKLNDNF